MKTRPCRVAIVDDLDGILASCSAILELEGYEVCVVRSPIGCAVALNAFVPDVVLLDVLMPALSGDTLLPILRSQRALKGTCFLLHSTLTGPELQRLVERSGAHGAVRKGDSDVAEVLTRHGYPAVRPL